MEYFWSDQSTMERVFFLCALVGGMFFLAYFGRRMTAGDDCGDAGFFSLPVLTSFFTVFGVAGLALSRREGAAVPDTVTPAMIVGLGAMWSIRRIFRALAWLEPICAPEAEFFVGREGYACRTIPQDGMGKVLVEANGRLWEFEALSLDGDMIEKGEPVRALDSDGTYLIVGKVETP